MTHRHPRWIAPIGLCLLAAACGDSGHGGGDYLTDGGSATYPGVTGNGTSDGDDSGAGTGGPPPPEAEDEGDFRVPRASGKYVYSASETTDSVAVIDTASLAIHVVEVGQRPTVVEPIPGQPGDAGSVVVLDQGSDDVAVLRTSEAGQTSVTLYPVTPGANNLAVSPGGGYVFVYHDVDGPEQLGAGSDQELTVLDLAAGRTYEMTVGAHPRDVVFAPDDSAGYVITSAGVNVIPFASLGAIGKPPLLPVVADPGIDPATLEVQIVASAGVALARVDGEPWLAITQLPGGERSLLDLPGVPTDLDVAASGEFAVLTLPSPGGSTFLEVPLPLGPGMYIEHAIPGEYVGLANLARDGDTILFYTTVNPFALTLSPDLGAPGGDDILFGTSTTDGTSTGDGTTTGDDDTTTGTTGTTGPAPSGGNGGDPRQRVTLARRDGGGWDLVTLFVEDPITSVGVAPDSRSAVLVHAYDNAAPGAPWSYSLFDLVPAFPLLKRQNTQASPGPILFTPDGGRAAVLLRDDLAGVREVDLVDLGNFIVKPLRLGSPPEGAGHVDATDKIFISQEHPTGRITFVDPQGRVQTVTGYVLNDSVKD
jgi:YVTN family beta-propeller protein